MGLKLVDEKPLPKLDQMVQFLYVPTIFTINKFHYNPSFVLSFVWKYIVQVFVYGCKIEWKKFGGY